MEQGRERAGLPLAHGTDGHGLDKAPAARQTGSFLSGGKLTPEKTREAERAHVRQCGAPWQRQHDDGRQHIAPLVHDGDFRRLDEWKRFERPDDLPQSDPLALDLGNSVETAEQGEAAVGMQIDSVVGFEPASGST